MLQSEPLPLPSAQFGGGGCPVEGDGSPSHPSTHPPPRPRVPRAATHSDVHNLKMPETWDLAIFATVGAGSRRVGAHKSNTMKKEKKSTPSSSPSWEQGDPGG